MPLTICTSNRMENLVEALCDVLKTPLSSPFTPEILVVQSKGMQRWLAMKLAETFGVWANCTYPFPNKVVWELFMKAFPELPDTSRFSPEVMTWRIMGLLPAFLGRQEFTPLNHYLDGDGDGLKKFQLAGKIADTFDQYTLFRPNMLLDWEGGKGGDWQELLWRELATADNGQHRGRIKQDFIKLLAQGHAEKESLPERIMVFGISYLPSYHLDIFTEIAKHTTVSLFLLSPCRQYWGDIVSAKQMSRRPPEERAYLEEGNPLLASLGKLARDFSNMVVEAGSIATDDVDLYLDPGEGLLLEAIQSDILNLRGTEGGDSKRRISPQDRSVQIHACHSPMREIEVLHDNLLFLLEQEKGLTPRDIIVMTPDIETYSPYISMVFGGCQDPLKKIPFSIADRTLAKEGQIASVILKLLELPGSRLSVTRVFDILQSAPVSRRFDLDIQELETVRSWIEDTRIRWGADESHRSSLGLPHYRENSWRAGLDRLMLGYAMPEEGDFLFHGILPYDEMEGDATQALGKLAEFVARIERLARDLAAKRTLTEWRDAITTMLSDFAAADDDLAHELASINGVVQSLEDLGAKAGFSETVDLVVIRSWLASRLGEEEKGLGFLTGGVTFCAMLPMRSIPFRVVCLIGMNDAAFPRQSRPPGFDLIARNPQPGDRSLRDEDRYLFLECLLSARTHFYLSYVGQSVKDNSAIPPSVLVSEFLDAIGAGFTSGEMTLEQRLVTSHRLQAFSRSYFDATSGLFSYSAENCAALLDATQRSGEPALFITHPLKAAPEEMREVTLAQLVRFYANPAKYLLENRLKIRLEEVSTPLDDREPFAVEGLEAYGINQELLEKRLQGGSVHGLYATTRCRGILPPAQHGETVFADALAEVDNLVKKIGERTGGQPRLEAFFFHETIGDFKLSGSLDGIWKERKISYRCAKLKAKDEIRGWIEHLLLNAFAPEGYPRESLVIMKDGSTGFGPVEHPTEQLGALLDCYWQGLHLPLRFFPASSLEFASSGLLKNARKKWESGYMHTGEEADPHFRLCFEQDADPLNKEFEALALKLLAPLVRHRL
ncbi:exodeoxyribonuclease V subunit gamma [Pelobacter propionicus]|uniref:DNA helicase/exodeoxyribonuclease V, gamma subunit n=1 Tax=Pelobacter propionicus (strain DSM 2379 / NBRC 103807 / OttBd1) TaxID=338966 RepID=A1AQY6_PELPD|nr:exodeoxyribonuclease V subunit gamma [Pelobacter propionicus]ABK99756.1 DNA helicase/exodeoxyribonuclease V, gamma subunit [Pelobacter propionicus DSM 2379]